MPTRQEKCVFTTVVITMIVLAKLVLTKIVLSMIVYTLILLVLLSGGSRVCTAQATPPVGAVQPANGHSITGVAGNGRHPASDREHRASRRWNFHRQTYSCGSGQRYDPNRCCFIHTGRHPTP